MLIFSLCVEIFPPCLFASFSSSEPVYKFSVCLWPACQLIQNISSTYVFSHSPFTSSLYIISIYLLQLKIFTSSPTSSGSFQHPHTKFCSPSYFPWGIHSSKVFLQRLLSEPVYSADLSSSTHLLILNLLREWLHPTRGSFQINKREVRLDRLPEWYIFEK